MEGSTRTVKSTTSPQSESTLTDAPVIVNVPDGRVAIRPGFCWDGQAAYLFDIDGTLLRSKDRIHYDSFFESVRTVMGHDLSLDGIILHGNTDPGILREAFQLSDIPEAEWQPHVEAVLSLMRSTVLARGSQMTPRVMPGVEATLKYLHQKGAALGVATGNLEVIGWLKVEIAGLRNWFTFGGFSDLYPARVDMIANAALEARRIAGPHATVCIVGDTPFDIHAAQANSLPTIAVATGNYSFDDLFKLNPEVCATSLEALLQARQVIA
jgi:phosphoglycolate phosphatase